ncbi:MAG: hypothetical protein ACR2PK_04605 [Acidimicrobiales bacterium]
MVLASDAALVDVTRREIAAALGDQKASALAEVGAHTCWEELPVLREIIQNRAV